MIVTETWPILLGRIGNNTDVAHFSIILNDEQCVLSKPLELYLENVILWLEYLQDYLTFLT